MNIVLYISEPLYQTEPYRQLTDYLSSLLPDGAHILHRGEIPVEPYSLVHFLGCPDLQMARALRRVSRQQVATVFSPLGCLQPWVTHHHPTEAVRRVLLVKEAVMQADAIHAWSEAEIDTLDTLRWNSRVALIPNAAVTQSITAEEMARRFHTFYQKIIDSNAVRLLPAHLRQLAYSLLQIGLEPNRLHQEEACRPIREAAGHCGDADWRMLMLFAYDERITPYLHTGASRLGLAIPPFEIDAIDRYDAVTPYPDNDLPSEQDDNTSLLFSAIQQMVGEVRKHRAPLCHYAQLYQLLRHTDYDEQQLVQRLTKQHLYKATQRLMEQMQTITGLTEGYNPLATL